MTLLLNTSQILDSCDSGIIVLDKNYCVQLWNIWLTKYTDIAKEQALQQKLGDLFNGPLYKHLHNGIKDALENGRSSFLSPRLHKHPLPLYDNKNKKNEHPIYQKIVISTALDKDKNRYCIINITDMTASIKREKSLQEQTRKLKLAKDKLIQSEKEIKQFAFHDNLTGLANRYLFNDRLDRAIAQAKRETEKCAVMLIDIDHFKQVNDTYGHDVGDELLVIITKRINECIRQSDTAARLGGDEFAVIQPNLKNIDGAATLAKKIVNSISSPLRINGIKINTSCSIGVSIYPTDGKAKTEILKNADVAMYSAKHNGKSNWQFFSESMRSKQQQNQLQRDQLSNAIKNNRIIAHYQPQINLNNSKVISFEALARYLDEDNNIVLPNEFISIAEENGLINEVTYSLIESVCKASNHWMKHSQAIALNLSSVQFHDDDVINAIIESQHFLEKINSHFEIELTESVLMQDTDRAIDILKTLSASGIIIAIDDFGTGYSSLEYLKNFPVKKLKIDRSFIKDIGNNTSNEIIVNTIIGLGHNLNMNVVAEGVENKFQRDFLIKKNCDSAQGYFYSRPLDEVQMATYSQNIRAA